MPEPTSPQPDNGADGPASEQARNDQADHSAPFVPRPKSGLSRLIKALRAKPDLGQVGVAILVGALGFTAVVQVRIDDDEFLDRARRAELFDIFGDLQNRSERLEDEIRDLQAVRSELLSGEESEQAAREQAKVRQGQLGVLAGTSPAQGPGIVMTIPEVDPDKAPSSVLLSVVQELRVAGAEALQVAGDNGEVVRVGVSTYFGDADGGSGVVVVDGVELDLPLQITAIGDAQALAGSMLFAGGVTEHATVQEYDDLVIDAVRVAVENEYAEPATEDE